MRCYRGLAPAGRSARGPRRNASRRELAAEECPRGHQQSFQPRVRKGWPVRAATAVGGRAAPASVAVAPNGIYEAASRAPRIHKVMMQREGKCTSFFLFLWSVLVAPRRFSRSLLFKSVERRDFTFQDRLLVPCCFFVRVHTYVRVCMWLCVHVYRYIFINLYVSININTVHYLSVMCVSV